MNEDSDNEIINNLYNILQEAFDNSLSRLSINSEYGDLTDLFITHPLYLDDRRRQDEYNNSITELYAQVIGYGTSNITLGYAYDNELVRNQLINSNSQDITEFYYHELHSNDTYDNNQEDETVENAYNTDIETESTRYSYEEYMDSEMLNYTIDDLWGLRNGYNSFYYRYNYPYDSRNTILDTIYFSINEIFSNDLFLDDFITQDLEDVKIVISQDVFELLDHSHLDTSFNNTNCGICLDVIGDSLYTSLDCSHIYHKDCIKKWLCEQRSTCPMCRKDVREYIKYKMLDITKQDVSND